MESAELTGASCPMTLRIGEEDKEFQASPFSDLDYDELNAWVQSYVVSTARRTLAIQTVDGELTPQQYEDEMGIAFVASGGVSLYDTRGVAIINTSQGIARIAWQLIKAKHPDIKYRDLLEPCKLIENQVMILGTSNKLHSRSISKVEDNGKDTGKND